MNSEESLFEFYNTKSFRSFEEELKELGRQKINLKWRQLGLVSGIKPNSKIEQDIIESYERIALHLVNFADEKAMCENFCVYIFPILRKLRTGDEYLCKKVKRAVRKEDVEELLTNRTFKDMDDTLKEAMSEKMYNKNVRPIMGVLKYKSLYRTVISLVDVYDVLSKEEDRFSKMLIDGFDFGVEVLNLIVTYMVYRINKSDNEKKTDCQFGTVFAK